MSKDMVSYDTKAGIMRHGSEEVRLTPIQKFLVNYQTLSRLDNSKISDAELKAAEQVYYYCEQFPYMPETLMHLFENSELTK